MPQDRNNLSKGQEMKKICFLGDRGLEENGILELLYQEVTEVVRNEDEIEFWFHTCHDVFTQQAVHCSLKLSKEQPQKRFTIVAVLDPWEMDKKKRSTDETLRLDGFPKDIVGRVEYAPLFQGKCEEDENRFVQHFHKVKRWLYRQCDDVMAYYYDNLPGSVFRLVQTATFRKSAGTLRHLYLPDTRERIDLLIERLPERERIALAALNSGRSFRDIAAEFGVSYNRAQQYVSKAEVRIRRWLRQN